jgi:hypothetical protein
MISALPLRADIAQQTRHVRFVPEADIGVWINVLREIGPMAGYGFQLSSAGGKVTATILQAGIG